MTRRTVQSIRAFTFSPKFGALDFESAPQGDASGVISLTAQDLSRLLENARVEMIQEHTHQNAKTLERLEKTAIELKAALKHLLELADHLDRIKMEEEDRSRARALMASACQLIVDGQGDLFDPSAASTDR
ncbi:MAG: hypothetical protein AAF292_00685 [Pseudomonadota bacterium]